MTLKERIEVLVQLGDHLRQTSEYREAVIHRAFHHNQWFTKENQRLAIQAIAEQFLDRAKLEAWLSDYSIPERTEPKQIGLVLAGNLPLVGFHDVLCVFVAGHYAQIKLSDKDPYLLPYLVRELKAIDERTEPYFTFVQHLKKMDAVIATGSNNSARYFEAYFGKYPHIIRRNRNAVAVLTGEETPAELHRLGEDVFRYFGLGCRNVSKIYVPRGYDFTPLLEALHEFRDIANHHKYKNNFDYNYALMMLNKVEYLANGCIILTENESLQSHIAGLYFEYYDDLAEVADLLQQREEEIQCVVSQASLPGVETIAFGEAQSPGLGDYADGVDTLAHLLE